ncbi:MAG: GGDEF domain-containing protein [Novosphingobium sp.]|nr:GGDEF domain-containing protein [Novosphingobium sp.]
MEMMVAQHFAIAFEVVVTSLGVADRFMVIKRQRDRALQVSRSLEHEVERDALTGLMNRRGIGARFEHLFAAGFDTMAVVDLDHFKLINDSHGHSVGDQVLCSVALALAEDENTLAIRMGGEEFLLLLRGSNAVMRAEHRRRAITARVAAQVPGLGSPVTASMGLVSQPRNSSANSDFATLYAHCDRLLYEAKRAGRNRTMSERIMRLGEAQTLQPDNQSASAIAS